jgi:hypothetical protein
MGGAALVVAVVAVCLGGASLIWQVSTWRRSGPEVRVYVHEAPFHRPIDAGGLRSVGENTGSVTVRAVNTGRVPAIVTAWGFHLRGETELGDMIFPDDPSVPTEVPPQGVVWFRVERSVMLSAMIERQMDRARGFVRLATEEMIEAPADCPTLSA